MNSSKLKTNIRPGCQDLWNAFMVDGAEFTYGSDMPLCSCITKDIPQSLISYDDAKHIHKINIKSNSDYHINSYVHFYIDDQKFDGKRSSIWINPNEALEIIRHFFRFNHSRFFNKCRLSRFNQALQHISYAHLWLLVVQEQYPYH